MTKGLKILDKGYSFMDSKRSITPTQDNPKETHVNKNYNQANKQR